MPRRLSTGILPLFRYATLRGQCDCQLGRDVSPAALRGMPTLGHFMGGNVVVAGTIASDALGFVLAAVQGSPGSWMWRARRIRRGQLVAATPAGALGTEPGNLANKVVAIPISSSRCERCRPGLPLQFSQGIHARTVHFYLCMPASAQNEWFRQGTRGPRGIAQHDMTWRGVQRHAGKPQSAQAAAYADPGSACCVTRL